MAVTVAVSLGITPTPEPVQYSVVTYDDCIEVWFRPEGVEPMIFWTLDGDDESSTATEVMEYMTKMHRKYPNAVLEAHRRIHADGHAH